MQKMRIALLWILLLIQAVAFPCQHAHAGATTEQLLVILDASGSMWGQVEGQPKIVVARAAASEAISSLPDSVAAGLMLYGHRRKGDCQDIELVAAPGSDRQELIAKLQQTSPKGKTPLAASLEQAAALLAQQEGEATVLLVSDGIETCGGDPCNVVAALREKGVKLVVHVVGFDVRGPAVEQLQCIAKAGGGTYFQADDTKALRQALQEVKTAVVEDKAPPPPVVAPVQAAVTPEQTSSSKRVKIAGPGTVVLQPAPWVAMPPRSWALLDAETGERMAEGNGLESKVKAGEYQALWRQSEHGHPDVALTATVQVESGKSTLLPIDTGIRLVAPAGVPVPYWWGLLAEGQNFDPEAKYPEIIRFHDNLDPQVVPAGRYRILWRDNEYYPTRDLGPVEIVSGRLNEVAVDSGLVLQAADWLPKNPYYFALTDGQGKQVARWNSASPQLAAPGKYSLVLRPSEHGASDIIWGEVEIQAHNMLAVPLNSGVSILHQPDARPPYRIVLVDLANKREIVSRESWEPLPVPPGRYRLDWQDTEHGSKMTTLAEELVVEPGVLLELEM